MDRRVPDRVLRGFEAFLVGVSLTTNVPYDPVERGVGSWGGGVVRGERGGWREAEKQRSRWWYWVVRWY